MTPSQKLPKNKGDLGKLIVAKGFKNCPKSNKSPNLVTLNEVKNCPKNYGSVQKMVKKLQKKGLFDCHMKFSQKLNKLSLTGNNFERVSFIPKRRFNGFN